MLRQHLAVGSSSAQPPRGGLSTSALRLSHWNHSNFLRFSIATRSSLRHCGCADLSDLIDDPRDHPADLVGRLERTETRHRVRVGEVPRVLRKADEIADRRIGCPDASKRRTGQLGRHARSRRNAGCRYSAVIDSIGGRLAGSNCGFRLVRRQSARRRFRRATRLRLARAAQPLRLATVALAPRPAREEILARSFALILRAPRRASASGSARSRLRLKNCRST